MKTSRQRVLDYIEQHKVATVSDLSRAMKMTPANARHHLRILEDQGLITVVGERTGQGRGRPANLYGLTQQAAGSNLDRLAGVLLATFVNGQADPDSQEKLALLADKLAEQIRGANLQIKMTSVNLTQRLYGAIQGLNKMYYQSRWEARADGPRMLLGNCPYAAIIEEHPELCRLDEMLIEELTGTPVRLDGKRVKDGRGNPHCVFRIMSEKRVH